MAKYLLLEKETYRLKFQLSYLIGDVKQDFCRDKKTW